MNVLNELIELDAYLYGAEDINNDGGPNTAMTVRQVLATALPALAELVEAAKAALPEVCEAGACGRLDRAIKGVSP